jgi:Domain of unknown function (DU1801)
MKNALPPFRNQAVAEVFAAYPAPARRKLLALRALIFKTAAQTEGVGALEETLKWGEPAYLTPQSKSGSTVRIAWKPSRPDHCAVYFNCQTTLIQTFKTLFPEDFEFEGNRAITFEAAGRMPTKELAMCIAAALTYHRKR